MFTLSYILAQVFGSVAFGFQIFSVRSKERRTITLLLGISNIFWVAHYIALGVPLAATIAALIAAQLLVSSLLDQKYRRPIIIVFIGLFWVAAFYTFEEPLHLLPAIGSSALSASFLMSTSVTQLLPAVGTSILSLSLLSDKSAVIVRVGAMISFSMWMLHGFVTGSVVEIIANLIPLIAGLYGLLVYDLGVTPPHWLRFEKETKASSRSE